MKYQFVHKITLGEVVDLIYSFKKAEKNFLHQICLTNSPKEIGYSFTYLSYLPEEDKFSYELKMNVDVRGSFTEFIRTLDLEDKYR